MSTTQPGPRPEPDPPPLRPSSHSADRRSMDESQLEGSLVLAYLLILSPSDPSQPKARFGLKSHSTIIGSSADSSTICLNHPSVDSTHLVINISSTDHRASAQILGATGLTLDDGRRLHPSSDDHQPPRSIELRDGDRFYISHFPFKWEQPGAPHPIPRPHSPRPDPSRPASPDREHLVHGPGRPSAPSPASDPSMRPSLPPPVRHPPRHPAEPTAGHPRSTPPDRALSPSPSAAQAIPACPTTPAQPRKPSGPHPFNSPLLIVTPTKADTDLSLHWTQRAGDPGPASNPTSLDPNLSPSDSPADPRKPVERQGTHPISSRRRSDRLSHELAYQKRVRIDSPIDEQSSEDEEEPEADDDDDDEDEDEDPRRDSDFDDRPRIGSIPIPNSQLTSHSPPSSSSSSAQASEDSNSPRPRPKSLLQTLLIKQAVELHLAQQTEPNEPSAVSGFSSTDEDDNEAVNQDDVDSTDEEQHPPSNEHIDDSSDEDRLTCGSDRMLESDSPGRSSMGTSNKALTLICGQNPIGSVRRTPPAAIFPTKPRSISTSSHFSPNDSLSPSRPTGRLAFDRRSISPNAKLLSCFEQEQSRDPSSPPCANSTTLEFPLKSSFRRQSYSPQELLSFSNPPFNRTPPSSRTAVLATVKHNTQINSRSPSLPLQDEDLGRNRLRSISSRASTPVPSCSYPITNSHLTFDPSSITGTPLPPPPSSIPHRIIRTPRSFLIKRRGSLTPLTAPVCGSDSDMMDSSENPEGLSQDHDDDPLDEVYDSSNEGEKRKVRFDRDVFCLEFDQLPEELPSSSRVKRAKFEDSVSELVNDALESLVDTSSTDGSRRNLRKRSTNLNTKPINRPRRHSPRLPTPPAFSLIDQIDDISVELDNRIAITASVDPPSESLTSVEAAVDLNSLTLNPDPIDQELDQLSVSGSSNSCHLSRGPLKLNSEGVFGFGEKPVEEHSILKTFTRHLFNCGLAGSLSSFPLGRLRQRTTSLPSDDLSKLKVNELEDRLVGLSLTDAQRKPAGSEKEIPSASLKMLRSQSLPSSPSTTSSIYNRLIKFPPLVSTFSPKLKGVKQIFMDQFNRSNNLSSSVIPTALGSTANLGDSLPNHHVINTGSLNTRAAQELSSGLDDDDDTTSSDGGQDDGRVGSNPGDEEVHHDRKLYMGSHATTVDSAGIADQDDRLRDDDLKEADWRGVNGKQPRSRYHTRVSRNPAVVVQDENELVSNQVPQTITSKPDSSQKLSASFGPTNRTKTVENLDPSIDRGHPPARTLRPRKNPSIQNQVQVAVTDNPKTNAAKTLSRVNPRPSSSVVSGQAKVIKASGSEKCKQRQHRLGATSRHTSTTEPDPLDNTMSHHSQTKTYMITNSHVIESRFGASLESGRSVIGGENLKNKKTADPATTIKVGSSSSPLLKYHHPPGPVGQQGFPSIVNHHPRAPEMECFGSLSPPLCQEALVGVDDSEDLARSEKPSVGNRLDDHSHRRMARRPNGKNHSKTEIICHPPRIATRSSTRIQQKQPIFEAHSK